MSVTLELPTETLEVKTALREPRPLPGEENCSRTSQGCMPGTEGWHRPASGSGVFRGCERDAGRKGWRHLAPSHQDGRKGMETHPRLALTAVPSGLGAARPSDHLPPWRGSRLSHVSKRSRSSTDLPRDLPPGGQSGQVGMSARAGLIGSSPGPPVPQPRSHGQGNWAPGPTRGLRRRLLAGEDWLGFPGKADQAGRASLLSKKIP